MAAEARSVPQNQYKRVQFHGKPVTARQRQALNHVERILGFEFEVVQGSWQPITDYSGSTHHGAGVCDLQFWRMDDDTFFHHVLTKIKGEGRQAAFGRGPKDNMPWHVHCCDLDTTGMDPNAIWQVEQWRDGNNGLNAGVKDRYPWRPDPIRKWNYNPG